MDILTLVKSNIRHKKGTFLCIMVFMMIISSSIASIVSLKKNFKESIESAYEHMEGGDITLNIRRDFLTEEMMEEVESHSDVEKVLAMDTILSDGYTLPDGSSGSFNLFLTEYDSRVDKLWKSDMTGYEEVVPELKKGEIYLPQAISKSEDLSIGDRLAISFGDKEYDFTIKGFVEEPVCGSAFIPVKSGFISSEDSKEITEYLEGKALVNPAVREFLYSIVYIYKADNCTLSDNRFASVINNDTEIGSYATSVLTKTDSIHYQDLYPDLTLDIFLSYVIILIVIVFVVMSNSISTGIELQYTDLGILKAEGFYNLRLKIIFLIQYMLAEIFGAIFGLLMSLSVIKYLPGFFEPIVGIKIDTGLDIITSVSLILGILVASAVFILICSEKIGRVSPIMAISGRREEGSNTSLKAVPLSGRLISSSLALRQFISGRRRYVAAIVIATMLVFFLMTVTGMTDAITSENAHNAMGGTNEDISVEVSVPEYSSEYTDSVWENLEKIENVIEEYTGIEEKYRLNGKYMVLDGEKLYCLISEDEEGFTVVKGDAPKKANEIAVGQVYAEDMGYSIGDKLIVKYRENSGEYVITGFIVGTKDTGRFFAMSGDAGRTLAPDICPEWAGYNLADTESIDEISEALENELPEDYTITIHTRGDSQEDKLIQRASSALRILIYIMSAVFAFASVTMLSTRIFAYEKTDIGIYKALGLTSDKLRVQFAIRFLIVSIIGIAFGTTLSLLFSSKLLSFMLRSMGIAEFFIDYSFSTVMIPIITVAICFFLFAYITASRVKKVEVRTLITE